MGKKHSLPLKQFDIWPPVLQDVLLAIGEERQRQEYAEGHSREDDASQRAGRLAEAAACYAGTAGVELNVSERDGMAISEVWVEVGGPPPWKSWPMLREAWKPRGPRRNLVRAAALIVAELERMNRLGIDPP